MPFNWVRICKNEWEMDYAIIALELFEYVS